MAEFGETNSFFEKFVNECIVKNGSLLTDDDNLFNSDNLIRTNEFLEKLNNHNEDLKKNNNDKTQTWGIKDIFNGEVFNANEFKMFEKEKEVIIKILLHCNWLMYLCSDRQHKQQNCKTYYKKTELNKYFEVEKEWAIGPTFSGNSLDSMLFIVILAQKTKKNNNNNDLDVALTYIESSCNDNFWKDNLVWEKSKKPLSINSIVNVILFLCDNKKYLPIPAQGKKEAICKAFTDIKGDGQPNIKGVSDTDNNLYKIREFLSNIEIVENGQKSNPYNNNNPFWHSDIRPFWDNGTANLNKERLDDNVLLEYKKAMILYGPPGTSKSYQARMMAQNMIAQKLKSGPNKKLVACIKNLQNIFKTHIHILQMHPNYTYDEFIIGKSLVNNNIVVKPGKIFQILKSIKDKLPYFVILDEINRVDISRVFGELFTAMEPSYRGGKGVELSVDVNSIPEEERMELLKPANGSNGALLIEDDKLYLRIPENLYFIGTMNLIDFSLEQVDFALRRRFLWKLSTYDEKRLDEIIGEKISDFKIDEVIPDDFSETCTALNKEIESEYALGKSYLIGHAFFSEIVDIYKQVNESSKNKDSDEKWRQAKNILWQVSIQPTLEAYCGTMDANMRDTFVKKCENAFMP